MHRKIIGQCTEVVACTTCYLFAETGCQIYATEVRPTVHV